MDLSRRLRSTALIFLIYTVLVPLSSARFHGIRHKRQNGARMYLPDSYIIPGDEGDPGDWSDWSSPSECSRSCGGGVSYQTRECLRTDYNGAPACSGGNRKYFSCNTQDCPEDEPDFRSQQCSRFDKVPFDGVFYNWVPYTNAPNPCELNCMPVGERFYFHQREKVIDGTRCNDKDLDVCVDGVCQPVGCDMMLGSDAKEDKCRKCGGDGSTCKTISDTLTTSNLAAGYNDILLIPSGATNIRIQETAPSNNYLACRNLSSHYYLNGNWRIDFPRPMFYAGAWWNYQRKPTGFAAPDYLTCSGPITESIYIVMLVQDRNVSINYEYSIPTSVIQNTPDVYSWTHMEFEPCSATCGGGTQSRTVTCNNRMSLDEVDPSLCDANTKPAETQECNKDPCPPRWVEGEWGKCSKGCGEDGFQNRPVTCERISPNGEQTIEEDAICLQLVGNKPATTMECNRDVKNCPKYHLGPWKPCDKLCGEGKQVRKVTCYIEENGRKKILPESECIEEKPETEKSCMLTPCEGVDWIISQWSGCDACGQNTETRTAICGSKSGKVYSDEFCGPEVPLLSRPCKSPKCPTQWFTSEWSKCSAACGKGVQSRVVLCGVFDGKSVSTAASDSECDAATKPESEEECEGEEKECPGEWFTGPWGPCSAKCGGGERVREVLCLANGTKSSNCDQSKLEFASEKCNTHACTEDEVIPVDSTAKPIDSDDEEEEDECEEDTTEFDVVFVTDKMSADLKISEGISLDDDTTTISSLITDELMLSDAPASDETELDESSTDIPFTTIEGSGEDSTDSTDFSSLGVSEGSGDDTDETTEPSDSTSKSSATESSVATDATSSISTEVSVDMTEESESTSPSTTGDSSISTDASETSTDSSDSTDKYSTTDSLSTISSEKSSDITNEDSTTDSVSSGVVSESLDQSTDVSDSSDLTTVSSSTDGTDGTESTLLTSDSTETSSELSSSDASVSTDSTSSDVTQSTDLLTTDQTASSESATEKSSLESSDSTLASSESSESTASSSTDTSISTDASISTESLGTDSTETSISTESDTTESTETSSTDTSTTNESDTTESTETSSTDTSIPTESSSTDLTTDISSSPSSTDLTTDLSTDASSTTDSSSSLSASEGTTQVSDETTLSSSDSTDSSTESSSDSSSDSTLSASSADTDSTDKTTESSESDSTDVSASTESIATSSSSESDSTEISTTSSSDSTEVTGLSDTTSSDLASSTDGTTSDNASSESTSDSSSSTSSIDSSDITTDISELTTDSSELTTDSSTGSSDSTTDSSIETSDLTTGLTELTSDSSELTTGSSELTTDSSEFTSESSDLTTDSSEFTSESSDSTQFTTADSTIDLSTSSDLTLSTDKTTVDFWSSTNTEEAEETSEKSTPYTLEAVVTKETKPKKCKAKKSKKDCSKKQFGCCPDKVTPAKGPFDEGCPVAKTCAETEFGCCLDGVSPAQGKNNKGCPSSQCAETLFGCCPDKFTAAEGEDNEGCPEPTTLPPTTTTEEVTETTDVTDITEITETTEYSSTELDEDASTETSTEHEDVVKSCSFGEFGCCPDGKTEAKGENFMGCDTEPDIKHCSTSAHGCCPDGRTFATGPDGEGCASCTREPFGCCQDNQTPAHGPLGEGCCLNSEFGCCPDNINYAYGPNFEGCNCTHTPYGCCPDMKQAARGYNNEGCSCETLKFGCCPDKITPATGPKFEGCACHTMQYGCCPDGITFAQGPHHYGCHCSQSEFKCCPDEKTSAKGPNFEGCTCLESKFGCCPDGVTSAEGEKFEGCENVKEPVQKACGLPKETGNCSSFSIKYFFDTSYGACARFWYGGCGGNDNKFETESHCKETCQEYKGKEACLLPKSSGPCAGYNKKWYFNSERNRCEEFNYGGCYGTSNRFDSIEECQSFCAVSESIPACEQPMDEGPCQGDFERWFYDNETDVCRPFRYGGCKGNKNNYPTEHSCSYHCRQPGVHKDYCSLPKQTGDCSEKHARWHFSDSDKKCMPFYYTGCGGNKNNFRSLESCEDHCPKEVAKDVCEIPAEVGECQNYQSMWYYDTKDERCRQFYYGGCGGNGNKFQTEAECLQRCERKPEPEPPAPEPEQEPPVQEVPSPSVPQPAAGDICAEQPSVGDCSNYTLVWYYDGENARCRQFYYGGCGGNENRFATEEECGQRCPTPQAPVPPPVEPQEESICEKPSEVGDCQDYVIMWFYNANEGQCQQFYYGGCKGNENRFQTEQECAQRCPESGIDTRFGPTEEVEPPPDNNVAPSEDEKCFLTPDAGNCNDNITRWFYNSADGFCDEFVYGGCGGNGNNFESEDACHNSCSHVQTTCSLPPVAGRCNDNSTRWYFDERAGRCYEFEFTGCRGNRNNFVTEAECLDFCTDQQNEPEKSPEPVAPAYSLCDLPAEAGECENNTLAWFYDSETMSCTAFTYTGCGGNGNRFESKEQCDRQCGEFRGIDVCNEPVQTGPCRQWQTRFYYNKASGTCEPFTYGGCDGTGNRFVLRAECESLCIVGQEPQTTDNKDICKLAVNSGKCEAQSLYERRWYYDDERGTCISFIYAGCAGNQNNFRSYESCVDFCTNPEEPNERTNEIIPDKCESYETECRELRCQYGVQRTPTEDDCTRCTCENPCEQHACPEGEQCAVEVTSDTDRQFEPVCRAINKPGQCPTLTASSTNCARECYTDADCRADNKCCVDGCGFVCVRPIEPTRASLKPTTPLPAVIYPGEVQASLEPKKPQELDVQTSLGGIAVLRCFATGIPAPNVTWSRHNVVIDTNQGRYVLTSSGDLTIVQVRQTDSGSYVCVADNGLGAPVQREVQLQVTEPTNIPAYIYGDKNVTQIVTLNSPALVRCPAGGHPAPQVSWWRNRKRLGLIGDRYEMTRDYALMFHAIQLSDLGLYTCEAYNHRRRPVSMKITLKAVGPARAVNRKDAPFLQYVIDPATAPITPRPSYPYRPTRPNIPPPPVVVVEPRQPPVSARAVIVRDPRNKYTKGSTVLLACETQGYPAPNITWAKNGIPLSESQRIQITAEPHRLVINDASAEDTGLYGCTARNSFSYSTSEEKVIIESAIVVHPDCVDNVHFANCELIVRGQYCKNPYYAKFCCRSCTLAGQLVGAHPNAV